MNHIKLFNEFITESEEYSFSRLDYDDAMQRKLNLKALRKKTKLGKPPVYDVDRGPIISDKPYSPVRYTDVPLDVYLQRKKEGTENKPKKPIQSPEELSQIQELERQEKLKKQAEKEKNRLIRQQQADTDFNRKKKEKIEIINKIEYYEDINSKYSFFRNFNPYFNSAASNAFNWLIINLSKDELESLLTRFYIDGKKENGFKARNYDLLKFFKKGFPRFEDRKIILDDNFKYNYLLHTSDYNNKAKFAICFHDPQTNEDYYHSCSFRQNTPRTFNIIEALKFYIRWIR